RGRRLGGAAGRAAPKGREADERDIASNEKKRGGDCRDGARGLSPPHHCARHPHVSLPALQYSVGLDEGNAAGRRLSLRIEIFLRLQPLFFAVLPAAVSRAHLGIAAPPG